jgi:peptidylprolyl isomerase
MQEILKASKASDWRALDPENTLYLELPSGRVVIEMSPRMAPKHAANVRALVRKKYFDGLAVMRVQDNYVVQWGDPDEKHPRAIVGAAKTLAPEFERSAEGVPFVALGDRDTYAAESGFVDGFPAAREGGRAWLVHCYGVVGVGRDNAADSGGGSELYAVIGHAPRHLDRNITVLGRVIDGMERLSSLPRGHGALGFYERPAEQTPLISVRLAADVPAAERTRLEVLRTDTPTFTALVESRRNRHEEWFKLPAGHIDLCNVPLPTRPAK